MKISSVIKLLENETILSNEFDLLVKETLHYLSTYAKQDNKWDSELLDELEAEQFCKPEELIRQINHATLSFAGNAQVPVKTFDDSSTKPSLPSIKIKERQIDTDTLPNYESPLICILQQVVLIKESHCITPQQLIDISRLLQCFIANSANLELSVLWEEEYSRSVTKPYTEAERDEWASSDKFLHERNLIRNQFKMLSNKNTKPTLDEALAHIKAINRSAYPSDDKGNQITKANMQKLAVYLFKEYFHT